MLEKGRVHCHTSRMTDNTVIKEEDSLQCEEKSGLHIDQDYEWFTKEEWDLPEGGDGDKTCNFCISGIDGDSLKNYKGYPFVKYVKPPVVDEPYVCKICGMRFSKNGNLERHMQMHYGVRSYACKICNKKFTQKWNMIRHMKLHTGEKPFCCEVCHEKFSQKQNLITHIRVHTGEKPFTCKICTKKFSRQSDLAIHHRTHTGEKRYSCKNCEKRFTRKSHLTIHLRIHTKEKPYSCDMCDKCFSQKSSMLRHKKTHSTRGAPSCENKSETLQCPLRGAALPPKITLVEHVCVH